MLFFVIRLESKIAVMTPLVSFIAHEVSFLLFVFLPSVSLSIE